MYVSRGVILANSSWGSKSLMSLVTILKNFLQVPGATARLKRESVESSVNWNMDS
jgi:hypothetical protein